MQNGFGPGNCRHRRRLQLKVMNKKALPFITILLLIVAFLAGLKLTQKNQGTATPTPTPEKPSEATVTPVNYPETVGGFLVTDKEICLQDGKPVIYYFGSSSCPHCQWESPVVKKAVDKFKDLVSFHNNMDSSADQEIFNQYGDINPGYIPFLIFGCKYARLGSGETAGEVKEIENLSALLCKLTEGKPVSVCDPLKEVISGIK